MSKAVKILQIDSRGQVVIPKELRDKLNISEGTGFYVYDISKDSIILKKIPEIKLARRSDK